MRIVLMCWADRHPRVPFLRGTDGLTGRQRRAYQAEWELGQGRPPLSSPERMARIRAYLDEKAACHVPTAYLPCADPADGEQCRECGEPWPCRMAPS